MSKPVNKTDFWRDRIKEALNKCNDIRYSVYYTGRDDWNKLNSVHKDALSKLIPKKANVLDAGCGYGRWSEHFDKYTGIDFSPEFIEKAKELYPDKKFLVADLNKLPFKDGEFDWAFAVSVKVMIVNNLGQEAWEPMEKELKRVAKKVIFLEYSDPHIYEVI